MFSCSSISPLTWSVTSISHNNVWVVLAPFLPPTESFWRLLHCRTARRSTEDWQSFIACSNSYHLKLNISKTKEVVVDYWRRPPAPVTWGLNWSQNIDALFKKRQSSVFFPKRLRLSGICNRLLKATTTTRLCIQVYPGVVRRAWPQNECVWHYPVALSRAEHPHHTGGLSKLKPL